MKKEIYMLCQENRVEDEYDGGLVLLIATRGQPTDDLVDSRLVMSFKHDEPMRDFPITRIDKQQRFYRVTIEEITKDELPPVPALPES